MVPDEERCDVAIQRTQGDGWVREVVVASDSEASQTKSQHQPMSLGRFALLAMMVWTAPTLTASSAKTWPPERHQRGDRP
jgi:hypothetical protein